MPYDSFFIIYATVSEFQTGPVRLAGDDLVFEKEIARP
jgi:hypothetical protein